MYSSRKLNIRIVDCRNIVIFQPSSNGKKFLTTEPRQLEIIQFVVTESKNYYKPQ